MAHKTLIGGTAYEIDGGKTLVDGTAYSIDKGKTLVGGTAYEVGFDSKEKHISASGEILDSWAVISAGTYLHYYSVGNWKTFIANGKTITMEIVAFGVDYCQDGTSAPITWIQKEFYWTGQHNSTSAFPSYGWVSSAIRARLQEGGQIYNMIPTEVTNVIKTVKKYDQYYHPGSSYVDTKWEKLWIPSKREIFGGTDYEHVGAEYTSHFSTASSRVRKYIVSNSAGKWWLRSASGQNHGFCCVDTSGNLSSDTSEVYHGIVIGFCT